MSLKALFSELYVHRNDPPEEFKELPAFVELSGKPDVVAKVDSFALPEAIKLICCSPELMKLSFAEKYKSIQPVYCAERIDAISILEKFGRAELLENEILKHADLNILIALDNFFIDAVNYRDGLGTKANRLKDMIRERKEIGDLTQDDLVKLQEQVNKITAELRNANSALTRKKDVIATIKLYRKSFEDGTVEKRRDEAYRVLGSFDRDASVKDTVSKIIETGVVTQLQIVQLKDQNFLMSMLFYLSEEKNKHTAIDILLKLYDIGAIDINEPALISYFAANSDLLLDYLLGMSLDTIKDTKSEDLNVLIDLALRLEHEIYIQDTRAKFCVFWNKLTDEFAWKWMFEKIETNYPNDFCIVAGCLMRGLRGKATTAYMNAFNVTNNALRKVTAAELFSCVLKNSDCDVVDSIISFLRLSEKNNHTMQVKLNMADRKLRCQSQDVFSEMYLPVGRLEELAINLSVTTERIDSKLVGKQLRDIVADLREALVVFGVNPVADIDDWKNMESFEYDAKHHRFPQRSSVPPEKHIDVVAKKMGFSYVDDEGTQRERPALVFREIPRTGQLSTKQQTPSKDNEPKLKRERNSSAEKSKRKENS